MTSRHIITAEEKAWMQRCRDEGVPVRWIAETIGCSRGAVQVNTHEDPVETLGWRQEWKRIAKSDVLYALHREFAPSELVC